MTDIPITNRAARSRNIQWKSNSNVVI